MKQIVCVLISLVLLICSLPLVALADEPIYFGDADQNGVITSSDLLSIANYIASRQDLDNADVCDTDSDGSVTSADLLKVQQILLGIVAPTPYIYTGLVIYPLYDSRIERDYEYDVSVTQYGVTKELTCYNHTDNVAASDRLVDGDSVRRFCEFAFDGGPVRVDITVKRDFESYTVMPSAKGFESSIEGNVISVYLDKPEYFMLKLDDVDNSILTVFADAPEYNAPQKNDENVLYIDGWYEANFSGGTLNINEPNTTVYISPGSVLNCRVNVAAPNVTICGRGMILDPFSNIYDYDVSLSEGHLLAVTDADCTLRDIKLVDARCYNLTTRGNCKRLDAQNVKILSSEMCTDGISQWAGQNNSYKHCYVYVGDNAVVITNGTGCTFEDLTLGTICAALFPQNMVGNVTMNDIYVFRCNEGLMRNIHNGNGPTYPERSYNLTVNNINAVDCDRFPYIFVGRNMGTLDKNITFNNMAVPVSMGTNNLSSVGDGNEIRLENGTEHLYTENYNITFNGLSVGGKAITDVSQLKVYNNQNSPNTLTVTGKGATNMPTVPASNKVHTVAPNKIYVGYRQLATQNPVKKINGTLYIPVKEVEKALLFTFADQYITDINGVKYVTLQGLVDSGATTSATYDEMAEKILIAPYNRNDNLLSWGGNEIHSRWAEVSPWKIHLVTRNSGIEYRMLSGEKNTGCQMRLTEQVRQYGAGKYRLTIDLRAAEDTAARIVLGVNGATMSRNVNVKVDEWTTAILSFNVENIASESDVDNAFIRILQTADNVNLRFKNAKLEYVS